jgi:4-hydroxybenzoyl-CoA reductase subunit beta
VRLPDFEYLEPQTLENLLDILAEHRGQAQILAGGTDLLPRMRLGLQKAAYVIGLKKLSVAKGIDLENGRLHIGALTTLAELIASPLVMQHCRALHEAARSVAAPPIQQVATLGGNICQNSRCLYYNQSDIWRKEQQACLKAGGERCLAVPGAKICFSVYQGDLAPAILALGGTLRIEKRGSSRTVPIERLFTGKGERPLDHGDDEFVTELLLQVPPEGGRSGYRKMRMRSAIDYPLVSAAAFLLIDGSERITSARLVLGGIGPAPLVLARASEGLLGRQARSVDLDSLVADITKGTLMVDNLAAPASYRRRMAPILLKRTVRAALEPATGKEGT